MFCQHVLIVPNSRFNNDISIHPYHSLLSIVCMSSLSWPPIHLPPKTFHLFFSVPSFSNVTRCWAYGLFVVCLFYQPKHFYCYPWSWIIYSLWNGFQCTWSFCAYLYNKAIANRVSNATNRKAAYLLPTKKGTSEGNRITPSPPTLHIDKLDEGYSPPCLL